MKCKVMTHLMLLISHFNIGIFFYKLGQSLRDLTSDKSYMRTKKDKSYMRTKKDRRKYLPMLL